MESKTSEQAGESMAYGNCVMLLVRGAALIVFYLAFCIVGVYEHASSISSKEQTGKNSFLHVFMFLAKKFRISTVHGAVYTDSRKRVLPGIYYFQNIDTVEILSCLSTAAVVLLPHRFHADSSSTWRSSLLSILQTKSQPLRSRAHRSGHDPWRTAHVSKGKPPKEHRFGARVSWPNPSASSWRPSRSSEARLFAASRRSRVRLDVDRHRRRGEVVLGCTIVVRGTRPSHVVGGRGRGFAKER